MSNLIQLHEPGETPLPHAQEDHGAVGIDLGTTHSVVAIATHGGVEIIRDEEGHALVPSVVSYAGREPLVGHAAKEARGRGEMLAVASIKRQMGNAATRLKLGARELTPVEISADILRHLKHMAQRALGRDVTSAVITVPAYFDEAARMATKDAARLAGLTVLRLINEPTAAALAYGLEHAAEGIYAIYDLGGGTFDISLLKLEQGIFQVLATGGDTALGGDDFDAALAELILSRHSRESGNPEWAEGVVQALARNIKERLSTEENVSPESLDSRFRGNDITRAEFDKLIAPWIEKTVHICEQVLSDAHLEKSEVKGVVLVGGSTRIPAVRAAVEACFGKRPLSDVNPDEVVAAGAALQADGLMTGAGNLLLDVTPLSLGLETMGGLTEKIIHRNTPIPVSLSQEFTTYQDGQTAMKIHVVQGEREMVPQNRSLAHFELRGIPQLAAGIARIRVTFTVDADGLLTVSAEELTTGTQQTVHVKPTYGLEPEEIAHMLQESMEHAREDITLRLLTEARVEAGRAIEEVESALRADGDILTDAEKTLIRSQIGYVKEAITDDDRDRIDIEIQQLGHLTQTFAERRMDRAIMAALKGTRIDTLDQEIAGDANA